MPSRHVSICSILFVLFFFAAATAVPAVAEAEQPPDVESAADDWWAPTYLIDYGIVAAGATGYIVGERLTPRYDALIGPSYDPDDPAAIFDDDTVGRTYVEQGPGETFPESWLQLTMIGVGLSVAGLETVRLVRGEGTAHQLHDAVVGYAEATAITATATSLSKPFFGRLRPDFADRALRYHCSDDPDRFDEYCDDYRDRPLSEDPEQADHLLLDGRRSFISGHSSHSFNTFTYASLVVGGHYVWGEEATGATRIAGIGAQTLMMGAAAFISGSRLVDGRHHTADVVAGSLVGLGVANLSYWRRFDTTGAVRTAETDDDSGLQMALQPFGPGPGASLVLTY